MGMIPTAYREEDLRELLSCQFPGKFGGLAEKVHNILQTKRVENLWRGRSAGLRPTF
jgi:hypothetical protein